MICTLIYLRRRFAEFNSLCFGDGLPVPRMRIGSSRRTLGSLSCKRERTMAGGTRVSAFTLTISAFYDLSQQEIDDTILHEMIHLYIMANAVRDTSAHGRVFRGMMNAINARFSRHITVTHKGELRKSDCKATQTVIAVSELDDGTLCVTRPAVTRIRDVCREISKIRKVKKSEWYNSANPFFEKYPRSLSARFYRIEKNVLERELSGAVKVRIIMKGEN